MQSIRVYVILLTIFTLVPKLVVTKSAQDEGVPSTVLAVSYLSKLEEVDITTKRSKSLLADEMRNVTLVGVELDSTNRRLLFSTMDSRQLSALYCLKLNHKPVRLNSSDWNRLLEDWSIVDMSVSRDRLLLVVRKINGLISIKLNLNGSCSIEDKETIALPQAPSSVTQDPCNGRVFWSNSYDNPGIHLLLPGDQSQSIISRDLYHPKDMLFNQYDRRLYWIDERGSHWKIESSLWDGTNRVVMKKAEIQKPFSLASDRNRIYWSDFDTARIWALQIPNETAGLSEPSVSEVWRAPMGHPLGVSIISPLPSLDDLCKKPNVIYPQPPDGTVVMNPAKSTKIKSSSSSIKCDLQCVHGACVGVGDASTCLCSEGYSGPTCAHSTHPDCHNFCLNGICLMYEGILTCSCHEGYFGVRCEKNLCHNWCLNNGSCSVKEDVAMCTCWPEYAGVRCEQLVWGSRLSSSDCEGSLYTSHAWFWATVVLICVLVLILVLIALMVKVRGGVCRAPQIKRTTISVKKPKYKQKREGPVDIEDCCNFNVCETPCDAVIASTGAKTEDSIQLLKSQI